MYTIEIAGPKNDRVGFAPTKQVLRGRWESSNVAMKTASESMRSLARIPRIPGVHIKLDASKRRAVIFDPLGESESGKKLMEEINRHHADYSAEFGGPKQAQPKSEYKDLSDDDIKLWLYHMKRIVDGGMGVEIPGSQRLPSIEEIQGMDGKRLSDPWNSGRKDDALKAGEYVDIVDPKETQKS